MHVDSAMTTADNFVQQAMDMIVVTLDAVLILLEDQEAGCELGLHMYPSAERQDRTATGSATAVLRLAA